MAKEACKGPLFVTVSVHVQGVLIDTLPIPSMLVTSFVLVIVRSAARTVTVFEQLLLLSEVSGTLLSGSAAHTLPPPLRGLATDPAIEVGVAWTETVNDAPAAMLTPDEPAVQVSVLLAMAQVMPLRGEVGVGAP